MGGTAQDRAVILHYARTRPLYNHTVCGLAATLYPHLAKALDDVTCPKCIEQLADQVEEALDDPRIDIAIDNVGFVRQPGEGDGEMRRRILEALKVQA